MTQETRQNNNHSKPNEIFLKDYRPLNFSLETVELKFLLSENTTDVSACVIGRRKDVADKNQPLVLDGHDIELVDIAMNGQILNESDFKVSPVTLTIENVPDTFTLDIRTRLRPQDNTTLMGLYKSGGNFCTQCEAEGFRKITYFLDRPDVLATYTTTIVADKMRYPVLLSNGNLVDRGEDNNGMHWITWHDPFPKPSYLFALVAGDLAMIEDEFITRSGHNIALHMYVQKHNTDKCEHAMSSLKRSMTWDEKVYGREYDLDVYMIVAVDDFNMGAMENKGLNIFNSKYVLARPDTATDADYLAIEGVIAHEYFHNWSGNRVTCRDWFQLSLKEGFTVFRDQEFTADTNSRAVKRINDVNVLRTQQFREDAGPMSHPVRPSSYIEINNFYTVTIYNKGAEIVRMLHYLVGADAFRKGTDLYFNRHDGHAVTTDDFVNAIEESSGNDFAQFKRWYSQAGTPELTVSGHYDPQQCTYTVKIKQACPHAFNLDKKEPFYMPFAMALIDNTGKEMHLQRPGEKDISVATKVLTISQEEEEFVFINIPSQPIPSYLRGFSAPVRLNTDLTDDNLHFLMCHDSDEFNRWEAGQRLAVNLLLKIVNDIQQDKTPEIDKKFIIAFQTTLEDPRLDKAFIAQALTLPNEAYLAEFMNVIDPIAIHQACRFLRKAIAKKLKMNLLDVYEENSERKAYSLDPTAIGRRSLKNVCLGYLIELNEQTTRIRCMDQFNTSTNMTDVLAALYCLANTDSDERGIALNKFYNDWKKDPLVIDKWLTIQAISRLPTALEDVIELTKHDAFNINNPNKVRALIGSFCHGNNIGFHAENGAGYTFLGDYVIKLNSTNPQIAARLASAFSLWRMYDHPRQQLIKSQLNRILNEPELSRDVYEVVSTTLNNNRSESE